ncbi:MAG: M1 family metallopeptidase [Bacillota bacterium]|nr:M1 family metallopeptidase [Bacillota bacterium]
MKKNVKNLFVLLTLLIYTTVVAGCEALSKNSSIATNNKVKTESKALINNEVNEYKMNIQFDPNGNFLYGNEIVNYINKTDKNFDEIYFHIYPNAYQKKETTPAQFGFDETFPKGFSKGGIDVNNVKVNGKEAKFNVQSADNTILKIKLDKSLKSGERIDVSMDFKVQIPEGKDRLSHYNSHFNLGNWYPIAAEYDKKGWHLDPYYSMGDPFYSDVSNYNVTINTPKEYIVAATGDAVYEKIEGDKKIYNFKGTKVRDFAWAASNKFKVMEKEVEGIRVKSYTDNTDDDTSNLQLSVGEESIKTFNKYYGKYPYKTYSIVQTYFPTGMEYPGIVFITNDKRYKESAYFETIVAHETAHQWWYGVVGDDEVNEAWLDESFACYSENIYYENKFHNSKYIDTLKKVYERYAKNMRGNEPILQPVNEFKSDNDYAMLVYYKGAVMLHELRNQVGDAEFFKILQTFYNKYEFKNATTSDFLGVVEEVTGKNWESFFDRWLKCKVD